MEIFFSSVTRPTESSVNVKTSLTTTAMLFRWSNWRVSYLQHSVERCAIYSGK